MKKISGTELNYIGRSKFNAHEYGLDEKDTKESIKFIEFPNAQVYSGAHAIFKALAYNSRYKFLLKLYQYLPGFALISEFVYKIIATNRKKIGSATCTVSKVKN